jgi:hypothetical protein
MRALTLLLIAAALVLAENCRASTNNPAIGGQMMTNFGSFSAAGGRFTINVQAMGGKLEVSRRQHIDSLTVTNPANGEIAVAHNASASDTISLKNWPARTNWFVYVENESRVWSYDGKALLGLLVENDAGGSIIYGPFPCEVPEQVRSHLPEAVRRKIKDAGK